MKKWFVLLGIVASVSIIVVAVTIASGTWSNISFEAVVQERATEQDGIMNLIVEIATEGFIDPLCSLHISENTKILDESGNRILVRDIQVGYTVKVKLKNSSIEGNPTYYPTVFEVKVLRRE